MVKRVSVERKIKNNFDELKLLEEIGEKIEAKLTEIMTDISTSNGLCNALIFDVGDGKKTAVWESSNLRNVEWEKLIGKIVGIEFLKWSKTSQGKRYKEFDVYTLE